MSEQIAEKVRHYAVTLQVAVTVEVDEEWRWEDVEWQIREAAHYTLLTPWEDTDVVAVIVNA